MCVFTRLGFVNIISKEITPVGEEAFGDVGVLIDDPLLVHGIKRACPRARILLLKQPT